VTERIHSVVTWTEKKCVNMHSSLDPVGRSLTSEIYRNLFAPNFLNTWNANIISNLSCTWKQKITDAVANETQLEETFSAMLVCNINSHLNELIWRLSIAYFFRSEVIKPFGFSLFIYLAYEIFLKRTSCGGVRIEYIQMDVWSLEWLVIRWNLINARTCFWLRYLPKNQYAFGTKFNTKRLDLCTSVLNTAGMS
jgi:hypothetical protein